MSLGCHWGESGTLSPSLIHMVMAGSRLVGASKCLRRKNWWGACGWRGGYGGSFSFPPQICAANAWMTPTIPKSMYTSCELFLKQVALRSGRQRSNRHGRDIGQATCPVTCGACNAAALNTTLRSCGSALLASALMKYQTHTKTWTNANATMEAVIR